MTIRNIARFLGMTCTGENYTVYYCYYPGCGFSTNTEAGIAAHIAGCGYGR